MSSIEVEDYTFEMRDEFERSGIAKSIIKLIQTDKIETSPMLIDGAWGTGKTEFVHKLKNLIDKSSNSNSSSFTPAL